MKKHEIIQPNDEWVVVLVAAVVYGVPILGTLLLILWGIMQCQG